MRPVRVVHRTGTTTCLWGPQNKKIGNVFIRFIYIKRNIVSLSYLSGHLSLKGMHVSTPKVKVKPAVQGARREFICTC